MDVDLERVVEATLDFYKRDPSLTPADIARFLRIVINFQSCDEEDEIPSSRRSKQREQRTLEAY